MIMALLICAWLVNWSLYRFLHAIINNLISNMVACTKYKKAGIMKYFKSCITYNAWDKLAIHKYAS